MRIAFFTDTYEPQINGVVKSIKSFEKILKDSGHEVFIFCPKDGNKKYSKNVFPIESFKFLPYPEYRVGLPSFDVVDKMEEIKPDIIHIHSPAPIGATGLVLGKIFKIPVIMTYHTNLTEYFGYVGGDYIDKNVAKNFTKWFFRKASLIIVPSESTKSLLISCGINTDMVVIPTPLEVNKVKKNSKKANSKPMILHVGRLCKEKKIDIVLKAFKEVLKHKDARLVITSDGPYRKGLENLAKQLGIENNVEFTGYLPDKKLMSLYSKTDVFVSASDTETQGIVLLEAFANSCPVVVRNATGFRDYVVNGKNGLLFNDANDLPEKILSVLENKSLRKRLVDNGLETIKRFTNHNSSRQISVIYESVKAQGQDLRLYQEVAYASSLFLGLLQSWFYRKTKVLNNPRFFDFYYKIVKLTSKLQYF